MHELEETEEKIVSTDSSDWNASLVANVNNSTDSYLRRPYNVILEENLRLRQAINDVVLTNQRWLRYNQEQAAHVKLLLQSLEDSEKERKKIVQELEAMKLQAKTFKEDWEHEHREKLQIIKEMNKARDLIAKLQEENWQLRTTHTGILISRGPSGSSNSSSSKHDT